jgi:hypothetical protein
MIYVAVNGLEGRWGGGSAIERVINRAKRDVELLQDTFDAWQVCRGERWSCSGLISTCAKPRRMVSNLKLGRLRAPSASHMHEHIANAPFGAHPP